MIILDTNVLSALMQQLPDPQVIAWLDDQAAESVWLTSITVFEARYGLALLGTGQRKTLLQQRFDELLQDDLQNRVLQFDAHAASASRPTCRPAQSPRPPGGHARHLHCRHRPGAAR